MTPTRKVPTPKKNYFMHRDRDGKLIPMWKFSKAPAIESSKSVRPSIADWRDKIEAKRIEDLKGLQKIFQSYFFSRENSKNLLQLLNTYSIADAILTTSGNTNVLIEYKNRDDISSYTYNTTIIEKSKYDNLKKASELLDMMKGCWYVVEYREVVAIWKLDFNHQMKWDEMLLPKSEGDREMVLKQIGHLIFKDAVIISKSTWNACPDYQLFDDYLNYKRNK